ncbi:hypothetical protein OAJ94_04415 [Deltaproteobacteria bacterium]|nr:hypothetical protein [Deltaproteobacteria bacterium]
MNIERFISNSEGVLSFSQEQIEVILEETEIDQLRTEIGIRHGIFIEFDENREILPLRNNDGICHKSCDDKGISRYLYARCEDWSRKQNPPRKMFHPEAYACMIWLVPQHSLLESKETIEAYIFTAKIMIDNHYSVLKRVEGYQNS